MSFKIQLADWRDREPIEELRREWDLYVEGGLYEMLHWPTYHVHIARLDGKVIGYVAATVHGDDAEDAGGVTLGEFRRQGVAKALRATQMRDLVLLGCDRFFTAVRASNAPANAFARLMCGPPRDAADLPGVGLVYDYGSELQDIYDRLGAAGAAKPYPLSHVNQMKLISKREKINVHLQRVSDLAQFHIWKGVSRGRE
jgi:GNAT superfamily N-acetyltransferase